MEAKGTELCHGYTGLEMNIAKHPLHVRHARGGYYFDPETKFSVLHIVRDTCVDIRESVDLMILPFTGCYYCHGIHRRSRGGGWGALAPLQPPLLLEISGPWG